MMNLQVIEQNHERVLTTQQLADIYECKPIQIQQNFKNNTDHFVEGKHYFKLEGDALKEFKDSLGDSKISSTLKFTSVLMLWTRRGASRHSKMLGTEKAWDMFDALEENYFNPPKQPMTIEAILAEPDNAIKMLEAYAKQKKQMQALLTENASLQEENDAQQRTIEVKNMEISDLQDRVAMEKFFQTGKDGLYTSTSIASVYDWSAKKLNSWLHAQGVQRWTNDKRGGHWLLYSKYMNRGFAAVVPVLCRDGEYRLHQRWTKEGLAFIIGLLRKHGIVPTKDREEGELYGI